MAVKQNLWSLTLTPGEKYPIFIPHDITLTSAALGEELVSETARSVIKLTHVPVNPRLLDSDSDSEIDSDIGSDDEELDDEQDEFELDEVEGFKKIEKMEQDGELDAEDGDEDEDEDEEESDEEDDDEPEPQTVVICSLIAGKVEQAPLNLTLVESEALILEVTGENVVHLTGNYIQQDHHNHDDDDDSDYDSEDFDDYDDLSLDDEELDDVPAVKPKAKITEIPSEVKPKKAAAPIAADKPKPAVKPAAPAPTPVAATEGKKRKADDITSSPATKVDASGEALSKAQKKKLAKKAKTEGGEEKKEVKQEAAPKKESAKGVKKTLPSGLIIEDIKVGDGPVARTGKRLGMRYIGKLESGKQFDANTAGKPFVFVLGKGEVIKGWDEGLAGMNVGGERRLTIPAPLAYGSQKIPGIPKNSTLKFDVKLVSVN